MKRYISLVSLLVLSLITCSTVSAKQLTYQFSAFTAPIWAKSFNCGTELADLNGVIIYNTDALLQGHYEWGSQYLDYDAVISFSCNSDTINASIAQIYVFENGITFIIDVDADPEVTQNTISTISGNTNSEIAFNSIELSLPFSQPWSLEHIPPLSRAVPLPERTTMVVRGKNSEGKHINFHAVLTQLNAK